MDEKKTYPVTGTVTISTEEYRDLICGIYEAKAEAERKSSKWYDEYNRAKKLESELVCLKEERDSLAKFVESKNDLKLAYKLFCAGIGDENDA